MFLELNGLCKSFSGREVIRDLTLSADRGEVVCLLGASGCGKTTTLRLVGGFLAPDAGTVMVDGVDVTHMAPEVRPKVLLLDEPFSNLDANLRLRMRREVRDIQRRFGVTMLFVTHDREEAMAFGDRIALMHEGSLVQVGTPREVYANPASLYCARFLGHVNELDLPGGHMLFRPEDVAVGREGGLAATVEESVFLGPVCELRLHVDAPGSPEVIARVPGNQQYARGTRVPLDIARTFQIQGKESTND